MWIVQNPFVQWTDDDGSFRGQIVDFTDNKYARCVTMFSRSTHTVAANLLVPLDGWKGISPVESFVDITLDDCRLAEEGCKLKDKPEYLKDVSKYLTESAYDMLMNYGTIPDIPDLDLRLFYLLEQSLLSSSEKFSSLEMVRWFLVEVESSEWFQERFGDVPYVLEQSKKTATSYVIHDNGRTSMHLHERHFNELMIFHELAHACNIEALPFHGPRWASIYIDLVREFMSDRVASDLEQLMSAARVKTKPKPRHRDWSPKG